MNKTRVGSTPSPVKLQKYKNFQASEPCLYNLIVIIGTNFCKANKAKTKKHPTENIKISTPALKSTNRFHPNMLKAVEPIYPRFYLEAILSLTPSTILPTAQDQYVQNW